MKNPKESIIEKNNGSGSKCKNEPVRNSIVINPNKQVLDNKRITITNPKP